MKLSQTGERALATPVFARLAEADRIETKLKGKLAEIFDLWCEQNIAAYISMLKRPMLKRVAR
ncbi:hypothetical protein D3C72_2318410 [compost metagenome]